MFFKRRLLNFLTIISLILFLTSCQTPTNKYTTEQLHQFAHQMPKTLMHIHFEGSVLPKTILELATKNNIDISFKNENDFLNLDKNMTFEQFVALFKQIINCLKTPQDYELVSYEFGKELARQNIQYTEAIFSMNTNCKSSKLSWQTILTALNKGRERAQKEFNIKWNWIFDLTRTKHFEPEEFLDIILKARQSNQGLIAMGFSEILINNQPGQYQKILDRAIKENLPIIPHAGEFEGPQSIWNSLNYCKAIRISHGTRGIEDQKLLLTLIEKQIWLDMCVTSNVKLGVVPNYKQHPVRYMWDAGACITISTDDPTLLNTDLNKEYDHLIDDYHFNIDELERVSLNGIQASFLSEKEKDSLVQKFKTEFLELRKKIF